MASSTKRSPAREASRGSARDTARGSGTAGRSSKVTTGKRAPARSSGTSAGKSANKVAGKGARKIAGKSAVRGSTAPVRRSRTQGISRVDQESTRTHGFAVRVSYQKTSSGWRPLHSRFFGDVSHGGAAKARRAAVAWLAGIRAEMERAARKLAGKR